MLFNVIVLVPSSSPTSHSLSSEQPFWQIMSADLDSLNQYWTVTAESGKQVHLYIFGKLNYSTSIYIIDGTSANGRLLAQ